MWWRSKKVWSLGLGLWALALLLPQFPGIPVGSGNWPPARFCVYRGRWDSEHIAQAHNFDLIITDPGKRLAAFNADLVRMLRSGADGIPGNTDDSMVLARVALGEDEDPEPGPGSGLSYYLDRKSWLQKDGFWAMGEDGLPQEVDGPDGIPDRKGVWGGYRVQPLHPQWYHRLEARLDQLSQRGVDGFFLDAVEVDLDLQDDLIGLIERLHKRYPGLRWVINGGGGLWQRQPQKMRAYLDAVVLESWFTQWNWSWGRAVVTAESSTNERLKVNLEGIPKFYVDYLDPEQPDKGSLLALRAGNQPAFWINPLLDKLDLPIPAATTSLSAVTFQTYRQEDGRLQVRPEAEVAVGRVPLPGRHGPWAVGAARKLRLRQVDKAGRISPEQVLDLPSRQDDWMAAWSVLELDDRVNISWTGEDSGQVWLGEQPDQIQATQVIGVSPLVLTGLKQDQLYWLSLSHPGGAPDRVYPVRPHDVSAPPIPKGVEVDRRGGYLRVSWQEVRAADLAGYKVYINRAGSPLGIPYVRGLETNLQVRVPDWPLEIRVTSFDHGNHESQPDKMVMLANP